MYEREISSRPHPPACTCVACNQKRLGLRRRRPLLSRLFGFFKRRR